MKISKNLEIFLIALILIAAFIFWDSFILFPVKLFAVIFHELSHVIVSLFTGGSIKSVEILNSLGGITSGTQSNEVAVLLTGYPGSLILGIVLYLSAKHEKAPLFILPFISLLYFLFGIFYVKNSFGIITSVAIALFFALLILVKNKSILHLILKTLSLLSIVYVINDIIRDTFMTTNLYSDAVRLEQVTGVSDKIWGAGWLVLALTALVFISINMLKKK